MSHDADAGQQVRAGESSSSPPDQTAIPTATRLSPTDQADILHRHTAMMWQITRSLHRSNPRIDREELFAEVRLGFMRAAVRFDPSRGLTFGTYAYRAGYNQGLLFVRRESACGMHGAPDSGPIWYAMVPHTIDHPELREMLVAKESAGGGGFNEEIDVREFWEVVCKSLNPRERLILLAVFRDGKEQVEIAPVLGVSKTRVGQIYKQVLEKLKRRMGESGGRGEVLKELVSGRAA